jgi:hypothetical protein
MKYFLHSTDSFDDEKVSELFLNFGYEGLGLFYTALEKLAKQEKPIKTSVLKAQLKVGKKLEKCWLFMESLEILYSNNGETFNKQLLNYSEKYKIQKEKNREKISEWRDSQKEIKSVTSYEKICNAPKVKESKVKESKVKKDMPSGIPEEEIFHDEIPEKILLHLGEEKQKKEKNSAEKEKTLYAKFINEYNEFVKVRTGYPAKMDGAQGEAAKAIIRYLTQISSEKSDEGILKSWSWILGKWDKLEAYHQNKLKLNQINSEIINIINQIKNGTGKNYSGNHQNKPIGSARTVAQNKPFGKL